MSEDIHFNTIQYPHGSCSELSSAEPWRIDQDTDCHLQDNIYSDSIGGSTNNKEHNQASISISCDYKPNISENEPEQAQSNNDNLEDRSSHSPFFSYDQSNKMVNSENIFSNDLQHNLHQNVQQDMSNLEDGMITAQDSLLPHHPENNSSIVQTKPVYEATTWPTGKDGGYSWIIVGAVFIINVIVAGYIKAFGVLLLAVHDYFPDASNFSLGLVMSLLHGCRGLTAPLMGAISVMIGARKCVALGVLLLCSGLLLAVLCTNVYQLAFTIGAMAGAGICMSETPGVIVVNQYFESLRSTANGLRTAGNPLGGMLFPLFYVPFLQIYGLKGTYIMISGVALQMCVMGFLLRSFHVHKKYILQEHLKKIKVNYKSDDLEDNTVTDNSVTKKKKKKKKPLEFHLLKNPVFLLYIAMNLGLTVVLPNSIYYSALYAKEIGLGPWEISILLSYYSGLDCICRLGCGYLTDLKIYKKRHAFLAGMFVSGVGLFLVPLTGNMWSLMAALSINALGFAYYYVLVVVLLADQFGEDSVASTWGFFRMTQGIGFFITPPLLGLIADTSGSLTIPFIVMGFMMLLPMIFFALQPVVGKLTGIEVVIT